MEDSHRPDSIETAVEMLLDTHPDDKKRALKALAEDELSGLHFGLGLWIRNNWVHGNDRLMRKASAFNKTSGRNHPDDISGEIVRLVWIRLNGMPA